MENINKIKGKWVKLEVGINFMGDPAYRKAWVGKFQGYDLRHYLGDMWEIIQNGEVIAQKWTREEMIEELLKLVEVR